MGFSVSFLLLSIFLHPVRVNAKIPTSRMPAITLFPFIYLPPLLFFRFLPIVFYNCYKVTIMLNFHEAHFISLKISAHLGIFNKYNKYYICCLSGFQVTTENCSLKRLKYSPQIFYASPLKSKRCCILINTSLSFIIRYVH